MNNKIKSLTLLVNLGIYGVAFPLCAEETLDSKKAATEETMVVTAASAGITARLISAAWARKIP